MVTTIRQEKVGDILYLIQKARQCFKKRDLQGGMDMLKEAQSKLSNPYLPQSRNALLGGLDSDLKQLKRELMQRENGR